MFEYRWSEGQTSPVPYFIGATLSTSYPASKAPLSQHTVSWPSRAPWEACQGMCTSSMYSPCPPTPIALVRCNFMCAQALYWSLKPPVGCSWLLICPNSLFSWCDYYLCVPSLSDMPSFGWYCCPSDRKGTLGSFKGGKGASLVMRNACKTVFLGEVELKLLCACSVWVVTRIEGGRVRLPVFEPLSALVSSPVDLCK